MTFDLFNTPPLFVHLHEDKPSSQQILDENYAHFNDQCRKVFDLLMKGGELTSKIGVTVYNIMDVRRRIKDLKDKGVRISELSVPGGHGLKKYFMTEEEKNINSRFKQ